MVSTCAAAVGGLDRLALDHPVGLEVGRDERAAALVTHSQIALQRLARVDPIRALGGQPLEGVAELGEPERVPLLAAAGPSGAYSAQISGSCVMTGSSTLEHVGLHRRTGTPSRAYRTPGAASSRERHRAEALARPPTPARARRALRTKPGPMLKSCGASSNRISTATSSPRSCRIETAAAGLDEEVEQLILAGGGVGEHEAAGAEAGQQALDGERGQHRADRGVERVAALAQDLRARLRGQRVPAATTPFMCVIGSRVDVAGRDTARTRLPAARAHCERRPAS